MESKMMSLATVRDYRGELGDIGVEMRQRGEL